MKELETYDNATEVQMNMRVEIFIYVTGKVDTSVEYTLTKMISVSVYST